MRFLEYFSLPFLYPDTFLVVSSKVEGKSISLIGYFLFISVFLIVLYVVMQFFGKRLNGQNAMLQKGIKSKVIPLGLDKRILAIELEGKVYLLYIDRQTTLLMDQRIDLPETFFDEKNLPYQFSSKQFSKVLESITQRYGKKDE